MRHTMATLALLSLLLAGCAGVRMSKNECELADWRAVGYEDGTRGRGTGNFGQYRKNCAEHGVAPDFTAYQAGREAGLREYCQESRGFQEGSRGGTYQGVCPADAEARFLAGYYDGRTLYDLESNLRSTEQRIRNDEARINEIEVQLTDRMAAAVADATTREDRARLLVETRQLAEERATLRREIKDLEARRPLLEKELANARQEILARR